MQTLWCKLLSLFVIVTIRDRNSVLDMHLTLWRRQFVFVSSCVGTFALKDSQRNDGKNGILNKQEKTNRGNTTKHEKDWLIENCGVLYLWSCGRDPFWSLTSLGNRLVFGIRHAARLSVSVESQSCWHSGPIDAISHNPSVALEFTASAFDFLYLECLLVICTS